MNSTTITAINNCMQDYLQTTAGCNLKRSGQGWKTVCPLHEEKSASFTLSCVRGEWLFKCFGCDQGGDLIKLHALLMGLNYKRDFPAIVAELAKRFEIPIVGAIQKRRHVRRANRSDFLQNRKHRHFNKLSVAAGVQLEGIIQKYADEGWRECLWDDSPICLEGSPEDDRRAFIETLYDREEIIFIGHPWDSGLERGKGHFQKAGDWLAHESIPALRIGPSTFQIGAVSRSKESIEQRRYLVLESDDLIGKKPESNEERESNKAATFALFQWCVEELRLRLAAVIDTGNRSLHGWFVMPTDIRVFEELKAAAKGLRLDPALFDNPAAPLRMPGCLHEKTGLPASLLYLNQTNPKKCCPPHSPK